MYICYTLYYTKHTPISHTLVYYHKLTTCLTYYTILYMYMYIYICVYVIYIGKGGGRIRKFSALTQTTITLR